MQVVTDKISIKELTAMSHAMFGNLVKAVVDANKKVLAVDAEMHADLEAHLLSEGSKQANLWGINLHPGNWGLDSFIEFDSVINLRVKQNNFSRSVDSPDIRKEIIKIVMNHVK